MQYLFMTFDNVTDILLAIEYFRRGETSWGATTLTFPILSNVFQSLLAVADGDHPIITCLKPFIDTFRAMKFQPVLSMACNRAVKSGLNRCRKLFSNDSKLSVAANDAISTIQYFTVISSFAAIGFIFAIMDYEVDTKSTNKPMIYGWIAKMYSLLFFPCFRHQHMPQCALLIMSPIAFAAWILTLFSVYISFSGKRIHSCGTFLIFSHLLHFICFFAIYVLP